MALRGYRVAGIQDEVIRIESLLLEFKKRGRGTDPAL
jgi:hypothetical protein